MNNLKPENFYKAALVEDQQFKTSCANRKLPVYLENKWRNFIFLLTRVAKSSGNI